MISKAKYKTTHGKGIKTLTAAQTLTNTSNTSESLLNEISQIIYWFYRAKQITKKIYNSIINPIKVNAKYILYL